MGRLPGPLILASASPRRRELLKKLGIPFAVVPSAVSENSREKNPRKLVRLLAIRKALEVSRRKPAAVVLGSDTVVVCRGEILGKPSSVEDSARILRLLNGNWQKVYTGVAVAVAGGKRVFSAVEVSRVLTRKLSEERLSRLAGRHMDKAGAYAIQDNKKDLFVSRIVGARDNVTGLPLRAVRRLLRRAGEAIYARAGAAARRPAR